MRQLFQLEVPRGQVGLCLRSSALTAVKRAGGRHKGDPDMLERTDRRHMPLPFPLLSDGCLEI